MDRVPSGKRTHPVEIGDAMTDTARLEALNKEYGTHIIISESTKKEIEHNPAFILRALDTIVVKGKQEPTNIFEILVKPPHNGILEGFNRGRQYYKEGNWQAAVKEFEPIAGQDGPSRLFLERCLHFQKNPPVAWNGIYEFKHK